MIDWKTISLKHLAGFISEELTRKIYAIRSIGAEQSSP